MKPEEAIKILNDTPVTISANSKITTREYHEMLHCAENALEKQIPKKPRETRCALMCSNCGHKITEKGCTKRNRLYCKKCGQALDWGDT